MPRNKFPTPTQIKKALTECAADDNPNKPGAFATICDCAPNDEYLIARATEMLKQSIPSVTADGTFHVVPIQKAVQLIGLVLAKLPKHVTVGVDVGKVGVSVSKALRGR